MLEDRLDISIEEVIIMMNIRNVYKYIARNKNQELVTMVNKPVKDEKEGVWKDPEGKRHYTLYAKEMKHFQYIKWENTEPVSLNRLLGGNYKRSEII